MTTLEQKIRTCRNKMKLHDKRIRQYGKATKRGIFHVEQLNYNKGILAGIEFVEKVMGVNEGD